LVIALCVVHNFIRRHGGANDYYNQFAESIEQIGGRNNGAPRQPESSVAKRHRDEIAQRMWEDYQQFTNSN
jgi:hypothetical protein